MAEIKRLDLLLKEISDPYVQENFWRLKQWVEKNLSGTELGSGGVGTQGPQGFPGVPGQDGAPGSQIYFGNGVPSNALGIDNDVYENKDNGYVYKKIAGVWVFQDDLTGPAGPPGASSFFTKITDSIPASSTKIIDTVPLVDFRMLEYTFRASDSPNTKTKGLKMVVKVTDSNVSDEVFSRVGDNLSMGIGAQIVGANVNLVLQNLEAFSLNYGLIRATL